MITAALAFPPQKHHADETVRGDLLGPRIGIVEHVAGEELQEDAAGASSSAVIGVWTSCDMGSSGEWRVRKAGRLLGNARHGYVT